MLGDQLDNTILVMMYYTFILALFLSTVPCDKLHQCRMILDVLCRLEKSNLYYFLFLGTGPLDRPERERGKERAINDSHLDATTNLGPLTFHNMSVAT
jgi:hypothetical protein